MADEVDKKLLEWVTKRVNGKAVSRKPGDANARDDKCFVLVDDALRAAGAKSARDFADGGRIAPDGDYVWGDEVELDKLKPGDVLQFRRHEVEVRVQTQTEMGTWKEVEVIGPAKRPHHSAVVLEVKADGSVVVAEQNVRPDPNKVLRNEIARLAEGDEERRVARDKRLLIKVKGQVKAYRPVPKQKGASLFRPGTLSAPGWRALAAYTPGHGGPKRSPGPFGTA